MPRPNDVLARACGWGCAWGLVVGLPPSALAASAPQAAAAAVVVWLLTAAAAVAEAPALAAADEQRGRSALPGGAPALAAAGLVVAAVLGRGAVAAAAVGAGAYVVGRHRIPSPALILGLPTAAAAIGAWSVVARAPSHVPPWPTTLSAADAGILAVLVSCALVATVDARAETARLGPAVRTAAAFALVAALAAAGRPGGLWLAVAAAAGAWPLRVALPAAASSASAHLIPGLLTAVAGIDRLLG